MCGNFPADNTHVRWLSILLQKIYSKTYLCQYASKMHISKDSILHMNYENETRSLLTYQICIFWNCIDGTLLPGALFNYTTVEDRKWMSNYTS